MDNMNRINTIEENLRDSISDYIANNLNEFSRNNIRNRNTTNRVNSILQSNSNNSNNETIENILESLNRNMLLYHVNITEYLGSVNTILDTLNNSIIQENNRERDQEINNNQHSRFRNPNTNINNQHSQFRNPNTDNNLNARTTYYYRSSPIRTNLSSNDRPNNVQNSDLWRGYSDSTTNSINNNDPSYSEIRRNIYQTPQTGDSREQVRNLNTQQRTPFNLYRYLSHSNEPFVNNELMQEYFQNLFQNVIISPTTEQIENATEVLTYRSDLDLINHSCPITLEEFQENETIRRIQFCGHCFSEEPIQSWFRNNVRCPVCRLDIRDVSGNSVDTLNANTNDNTNENNNIEETIDEENLTGEFIDRNEYIPSPPRPLRPSISDLSVSTSSTINDLEMDTFLSNFANNIRDNLTENLENIMIPIDNELSSHIQLDIPLERYRFQQWRDLSGTVFPLDYP
jgi:hypothetical protein